MKFSRRKARLIELWLASCPDQECYYRAYNADKLVEFAFTSDELEALNDWVDFGYAGLDYATALLFERVSGRELNAP